MINCFGGVLEHRLEFQAEELVAIAPQLASVSRYILEHYGKAFPQAGDLWRFTASLSVRI
jgi:hypothetical protein